MRKILYTAALALILCMGAQAQEAADRVRLISAKSAELIENKNGNFRKVVGPAKFFHNDTYLLCDTALWNVNTNIIDAVGHVSIIQNRTKLTSTTLQYVVDENMARFRGDLVQLEDDQHNTLRTRYLDYNTKDSVAIFQGGAAMKDKDGQVIESQYGTYDSKAHLFVFNDKVNMYLDTTFVKTSRLEYRSDLSTAYFGYATDMWQDDKMLSADDGWYRRPEELFFFRRKVHILTPEQEAWSDTLYYHRNTGEVSMLGKVEIMDTTRNVFALAGRLDYIDTLSQVTMTRKPAIMSVSTEKGRRDSLYLGAEIINYRTIKRNQIPEPRIKDSQKRIGDISGDPVMEYRRQAAEAAAKAAEEAAAKDPNRPPVKASAPPKNDGKKTEGKQEDKPEEKPAADSLAAKVEPPVDSSKVGFLKGSRNVKMFRRDMQMCADSLDYCDLDSLVRLYKDPIFYNQGDRQYAADSIYMVIRNKRMEKAHLLSNAFITIQEDTSSYDQIRGAEMVAYFDSTSALTRFDALGGAASVFYLVENNALATVNKVESKMIYATFKDSDIERIYYYDNPKNDGYPTVQMPQDERRLKGFRWEPDRRPASPKDVTPLVPRLSQRTSYLARPHTTFTHTEIYFPGHINRIYRDIAIRDSLKVLRDRAAMAADTTKKAAAAAPMVEELDTLSSAPVPAADSIGTEKPAVADSTAAVKVEVKDTLSPKEIKKLEREKLKAKRKAEREARWAEKDRKYAQKQAAREERKLQREMARKLKAERRIQKRLDKEKALLEKYVRKEREKYLKKLKKHNK